MYVSLQLQHYQKDVFTDANSRVCTNLQSLIQCLDREVRISQLDVDNA